MALIKGERKIYKQNTCSLSDELFYVLFGDHILDDGGFRADFEIIQHRDGTRSLILTTKPADAEA